MSIEVWMEYTGIIGLVPKSGGCFALIPDASGDPHHPHHASLIVLNPGTFQTSREGRLVGEGNLPGCIALEGHEILLDDGSSPPLTVRSKWILDLSKGCPAHQPGCEKVSRSLLRGALPPEGLAGRCKMSRGELATSFVEKDRQWHFINPDSEPMWLAQAVRHQFSLEGTSMNLKLESGSSLISLEIEPVEQRIDLIVANLPSDPPHHGSSDELDPHVTIHYDLARVTVPPSHRRALRKKKATYGGSTPLPGHGDDSIWAKPRPLPPCHRPGGEVTIMIPHGHNCPPGLWADET